MKAPSSAKLAYDGTCTLSYASRMNFYRDDSDWKPFHHDSHAYGGKSLREDFTIGASFGATRELAFLHEPSGGQFSFPQGNGDIFAFSSEVNKALGKTLKLHIRTVSQQIAVLHP